MGIAATQLPRWTAETIVVAASGQFSTGDEVLDALAAFVAVLESNRERTELAMEKARALRERRAEGMTYREIVSSEERPLIVELATNNIDALHDAGSRFRRAEAAALHREGLTMDRIAQLFGVTRQRVSALLRHRRAS